METQNKNKPKKHQTANKTENTTIYEGKLCGKVSAMLRATELISLTEHGLDYRVHRKLKWHLTHFLRKINCRVTNRMPGWSCQESAQLWVWAQVMSSVRVVRSSPGSGSMLGRESA